MATGPQRTEPAQASTLYLRVPLHDWPAVRQGVKTEFRLSGRQAAYPALLRIVLPTGVVAYAQKRDGTHHDHRMFVVEECWREPLAAISDESLEREGFESMAHFRRYWMDRTKHSFRPLQQVQVFRVRPYTPEDRELLGGILFDRLFGEFTGAHTERSLLSQRGPVSAGLR